MRKRSYEGTTVQKQNKRSHKKECDLGRKCPYQEEYQHMLEFSHDCAPVAQGHNANQPFSGRGNRHVGSREPFGGGGHRLGGSGEPNWNQRILQTSENSVQCGICSAKVSLEQLSAHLAHHEGKGRIDTLKKEQDSALEESVLLDIQRQSEEESTRKAGIARDREAAEIKEFEAALAMSISEAHKADRELAAQNLLPEPAADFTGDKVMLKFALSDTNKLKRTFRANNPVQDAFDFLRAQAELEGKSFVLRNAVNTLSLEAGDQRSFALAGVASSSYLLVVVKSDPAPAVIASVATSSSSSSGSTVPAAGSFKRAHSAGSTGDVRSEGVVVDLLKDSPQPARKTAHQASRGGSHGGLQVTTPHRTAGPRGVIDLTLS